MNALRLLTQHWRDSHAASTPASTPASYHTVITSRTPYLAAGSHAEILGKELVLKTALDPSTSHHSYLPTYLPTYAHHAWHYSIELIAMGQNSSRGYRLASRQNEESQSLLPLDDTEVERANPYADLPVYTTIHRYFPLLGFSNGYSE